MTQSSIRTNYFQVVVTMQDGHKETVTIAKW